MLRFRVLGASCFGLRFRVLRFRNYREIREPVRSYVIDLCSSFAARDCNACFSQIFGKRTFGYLNEEEERTFDSFCRSCSSSVTLNSSILLTVVTAYGLNQLGLDNNMWPIFVTQMHTNPGRFLRVRQNAT